MQFKRILSWPTQSTTLIFLTTSYSLPRRLSKVFWEQGGFAVSRFDSVYALYDSAYELLQEDEDISIVEKIMDVEIGVPFISAHHVFIENMSPEGVEALLLHEEGHIALEHHVHYSALGHILQHELEADAYAADKVGKAVVAKALEEAIKVAISFMGVPKDKREDCFKHVLASENMSPRFEALK